MNLTTEKFSGIEFSKHLCDFRNGKKIDWKSLKKSNLDVSKIYHLIADDFYHMYLMRTGQVTDDENFKNYFFDFYGNNFTSKKLKKISSVYEKKSDIMRFCNRELLFGVKKGHSYDDKKLLWCHSCRDRYCALCQHKTSRVLAYRTSKIMNVINKRYDNISFIFLTLTVRNVKRNGLELKDLIKKMNSAYHKMLNYSAFTGKGRRNSSCEKQIIKGTMKKIEITYNRKSGEFHPHFHVLLAVDSEYFLPKYFINQKRWVEIWKKAMGLSYDPYVYVESVSSSSKHLNSIDAAAYEITKYVTKSKDIIGNSDMTNWESKSVLFALNNLKGMRFYSFTGLFKQVKLELFGNNEEMSNSELINADGISKDSSNDYVLFTYLWSFKEDDYLIWNNNQNFLSIYWDWRKNRCKNRCKSA